VPQDKSVLVLLALVAYPGPFLVFGLSGFLMANVYRSRLINATFNAGALVLVSAWLYSNFSVSAAGPRVAWQLNESLFNSLLFGLGFGVVFAVVVWFQIRLIAAAEGR
jgi:hypothetical protein